MLAEVAAPPAVRAVPHAAMLVGIPVGFALLGFALRLAAYLKAGWEPHVWTYPDGLCRWDCQWYVNLAKAGYDSFPVPGLLDAGNWAFFPLMPMLVGAGHSWTGLPVMDVASALSIVFSILAALRRLAAAGAECAGLCAVLRVPAVRAVLDLFHHLLHRSAVRAADQLRAAGAAPPQLAGGGRLCRAAVGDPHRRRLHRLRHRAALPARLSARMAAHCAACCRNCGSGRRSCWPCCWRRSAPLPTWPICTAISATRWPSAMCSGPGAGCPATRFVYLWIGLTDWTEGGLLAVDQPMARACGARRAGADRRARLAPRAMPRRCSALSA